jgi:hypothetical protein|tara:strand:+ start:171 stop:497 length:327 start_codon:yes stop_codon:yes gene_type:complete
MINKENEYNKGIFNLLNKDFEQTTDDKIILNLIKELFLTDVNDINNEDLVISLLKDDNSEDGVINSKSTDLEQTIEDEVSSNSSKSLLFTEIDSINNESSIKKSLKDE